MGALALVLGLVGAVFAVIPYFAVSQAAGALLGSLALVLGFIGVRRSRRSGRGRGIATAGMVVGGAATLLSVVVFASFAVIFKKIGTELEGGAKLGGPEFHRAMESAIERARREGRTIIDSPPGQKSPR